jgi:hypothetical protein
MKVLNLLCVSLFLMALSSCNKSDSDTYPYTVTYQVTSEATTIAVAYYDNGSVVSDNVQSGWSREAVIDKGYATISAGALDDNTTRVKAQILRDGKVIKEGEGLTVLH